VAWDEQELLPKLREQFGAFSPALVLAHEWGHAIQARVGYETYQTVYMEQQADCFAGAWTAHVANGDSSLHLDSEDLDTALAGLLQLRDPSGTDGGQDGAHGNGFDRVRAFQDGFEGGAQTCADYQEDAPPVTEAGYTSQADYMNGGDMSLADVLPALSCGRNTLGNYPRLLAALPQGGLVAKTGTLVQTDGGVVALAGWIASEGGDVVFCLAAPRNGARMDAARRAQSRWLLDLAPGWSVTPAACGPSDLYSYTDAAVAAVPPTLPGQGPAGGGGSPIP